MSEINLHYSVRFRNFFSQNGILAFLALSSVLFFLFVLQRSYMVARTVRNADLLPIIHSKTDIPKVKYAQKQANLKTNSFYNSAADKNEKIKISENANKKNVIRTLKDDDPIDRGIDDMVDNILNDIKNSDKKSKKESAKKIPTTNAAINVNNSQTAGHRVQIIAFRDKEQGTNYANSIRKKHGDLLKNLNIFISELNLKEKGIFYRVQVGEFATRDLAKGFCENFLKKNSAGLVNCIVVK
ncbi:hypothetical protein FACS1894152_1280 [Bacilli bacterium]|nr:hypothetical protein FACS1894152_1280 [Bacilli bacterium]